jgi:hypothetical protein
MAASTGDSPCSSPSWSSSLRNLASRFICCAVSIVDPSVVGDHPYRCNCGENDENQEGQPAPWLLILGPISSGKALPLFQQPDLWALGWSIDHPKLLHHPPLFDLGQREGDEEQAQTDKGPNVVPSDRVVGSREEEHDFPRGSGGESSSPQGTPKPARQLSGTAFPPSRRWLLPAPWPGNPPGSQRDPQYGFPP